MVDPVFWDAALTSCSAVLAYKITQWAMHRRTKPKETPEQALERHLAKARAADPIFAVQNPETEELRKIYREIDEELMLADEVRTPPAPVEVRFAQDQEVLNLMPPVRKSRKVTGKPRPGTPLSSSRPHPDNLMIGHPPYAGYVENGRIKRYVQDHMEFGAMSPEEKVEYMKLRQEELRKEGH